MPLWIALESGFDEAVTLITAHQQTHPPSTTILPPNGLLAVKIVEARGLRKCTEPYIVAVFQKRELISEEGYENGAGEDGRAPFAMTLRS